MTYTKSITIWCDGDDCEEWVEPAEWTAARARKWARDRGWRTGLPGGKDLCPDCREVPSNQAGELS